jgi:serine/threonine protein kinase
MGEVYRATDTRLKRDVAVKVLSLRLVTEPSAKQRFERAAHAASALNDPHICTIYDVGEHDGQQFLVMELLEGQTLKQYMDGRALAVRNSARRRSPNCAWQRNHSSGSQAREYFCHDGRRNQSARLWLGKITCHRTEALMPGSDL